MALIKNVGNSESTGNSVGWGLKRWTGFKKVDEEEGNSRWEKSKALIILTLGNRCTGLCLLPGLVLRILFISCGRKVRAASETQTDGRAPGSRHRARHRVPGCGSVL